MEILKVQAQVVFWGGFEIAEMAEWSEQANFCNVIPNQICIVIVYFWTWCWYLIKVDFIWESVGVAFSEKYKFD